MPGRTPKSLQHQWAHIRASVAELEKSQGISDGTASAVTKKGAGRFGLYTVLGISIHCPDTIVKARKQARSVAEMSWQLQRQLRRSKSVREKVRLNILFAITLPVVNTDFALVVVLPKSPPTGAVETGGFGRAS